MAKPGPTAGSEGAKKIAEAHRGSHDHDKEGGFAANPDLPARPDARAARLSKTATERRSTRASAAKAARQ